MQITKEITIETTIDIDPIYRLRCSNSCIHYDAIMGVCGLFGEIINEGGERVNKCLGKFGTGELCK